MSDMMVTIEAEEYDRLVSQADFLKRLIMAGGDKEVIFQDVQKEIEHENSDEL